MGGSAHSELSLQGCRFLGRSWAAVLQWDLEECRDAEISRGNQGAHPLRIAARRVVGAWQARRAGAVAS